MLSTLFTSFDKVCYQYSLYKVYTIGDCYVVLSFVNAANRDPGKEANSMVKMAMAMIEIIREVRAQVKFEELDMRIGIHTVIKFSLNSFSEHLREMSLEE